MTGAHEHAAGLRDQRKDVPGLDDVGRLRIGARRHADRVGTIGGRDAGGDAFGGLDRHREVGAVDRAVLPRHRRQLQALRVFER